MHVVIVGGSLVGLMHGIMLKHHGYDVDILEKLAERLEGQAAGVGTGLTVKEFLSRHDRLKGSFSFPSNGLREIDMNNKMKSELRMTMAQTSWDALYHRFRANFDHVQSLYCPEVPSKEEGDGKASYHHGKEVISITSCDKDGGRGAEKPLEVCYQDVRTGKTSTISTDLVIGADGSNSSVRSLFSPKTTGRRYCGYVMWRGLVPERQLSQQTRKQCSEWFTFCLQSPPGYALLYPIPGKTGSMKDGERQINLAWYSRLTHDELSDALTDIDGHKHQWSVPLGKLRPAVWQNQLQKEGESLNVFAKDVSTKIEQPFLQVVGDFEAPQASFLQGRVLLVGDGLVTLRPHTGFGLSSGAFHALSLEKALFERDTGTSHEAAICGWEKSVFEYSHMERLRSISWGEYYLGSWLGWLSAAVHYHGLLKVKSWRAWAANLI